MPRKMTSGSAGARGNEAKNALFGGEPFVVKNSGKRIAEQGDTSALHVVSCRVIIMLK